MSSVTAPNLAHALEERIVFAWQPGDQPVLARDVDGRRFWAWLRRIGDAPRPGRRSDPQADPHHPWSPPASRAGAAP